MFNLWSKSGKIYVGEKFRVKIYMIKSTFQAVENLWCHRITDKFAHLATLLHGVPFWTLLIWDKGTGRFEGFRKRLFQTKITPNYSRGSLIRIWRYQPSNSHLWAFRIGKSWKFRDILEKFGFDSRDSIVAQGPQVRFPSGERFFLYFSKPFQLFW